jgi:hypothetical protein
MSYLVFDYYVDLSDGNLYKKGTPNILITPTQPTPGDYVFTDPSTLVILNYDNILNQINPTIVPSIPNIAGGSGSKTAASLQYLIVTKDANYSYAEAAGVPDPPLPDDAYMFPKDNGSGIHGDVLSYNSTYKTLVWTNPTVPTAGQIANGGNAINDDISIGTLDLNDFKLISGKDLVFDSAGDIIFNRGIRYKYDLIDTGNSLNVTSEHYLISIGPNADPVFNINLPAVNNTNVGRQYIISNDSLGVVNILPNNVIGNIDKIDGETLWVLDMPAQRIRITSTGVDNWYII